MAVPRRGGESRTFGIEIAGRPCAGKTTLATDLVRVMSQELDVEFHLIKEAWPRFPEPDWKLRWEFSAWTMMQAITYIIEYAAAATSPVLVLDKGLVDVQCWLEWFTIYGKLEEPIRNGLRQLRKVSRFPAWYDHVDIVLVLDASYETAARRRGGDGRIVNERIFEQLANAYERVLSSVSLPVERFWTDKSTQQDTLDWARDVVRRFYDKWCSPGSGPGMF